jgi:hypothetical protein
VHSYLYTLHLRLKDLRHATKVRIVMMDDTGQHEVYNKLHNDGDEFDVTSKGKLPKATFNIYYDGVFVMSVDKDVEANDSNDTIQPDVANGGDQI